MPPDSATVADTPRLVERPSFLSDVHALRVPRARIYAHRVVGLPVDVSALRYVRTASWPPAPKTSNARTGDAAAHHGPGFTTAPAAPPLTSVRAVRGTV